MARTRVFISSTYYDLKHARSSLESFMELFGFDPVLSERGDVPYLPNSALDDSCFAEVENADILVLIIGGRAGSKSSADTSAGEGFYSEYNSITKREFETAISKDIPVFVLIESAVLAEHRTYSRNRNNKHIAYAHVDSVSVFHLIDEIVVNRRNVPVFAFDRLPDAHEWLREQVSGLFREMLKRRSQSQEIAAMREQLAELKSLNGSMKAILDEFAKTTGGQLSTVVSESDKRQHDEMAALSLIKSSPVCQNAIRRLGISQRDFLAAMYAANDLNSFAEIIDATTPTIGSRDVAIAFFARPDAIDALNDMRQQLNLTPFELDDEGAGVEIHAGNGRSVVFRGIAGDVAEALRTYANEKNIPVYEISVTDELASTLFANPLLQGILSVDKLKSTIENIVKRLQREKARAINKE